MNRGFFKFPVLVIERLNVYVSLLHKRKLKKFVLFVMLMMSVVSVSAQRWSLTPEVGMTAVKRGGFSYIDEPGYTWNARWKIGVGVEYVVKPDRFH